MPVVIAAPDGYELSKYQKEVVKQSMVKLKDTVTRLASDHRDLHGAVSKVGKAIDRNFVPDFAATSREDVFNTPEKIRLINKVICEHFCRHGMQEVAQELAKVNWRYRQRKTSRRRLCLLIKSCHPTENEAHVP